MSKSTQMLNLQQVETLLHNISHHQLKRVLEEYRIKGKEIGAYTFYNIEDINKIKSIMEEKYQFNKDNRLVKSQALELGLHKQTIKKFKKFPVEPIERIYEFKGAHAFYPKDEILQKIFEIKEEKRLLGVEKIKVIIGASHANQVKEILKYFDIKGKKFKGISGLRYEPLEIEKVKKLIDERYQYNLENYLPIHELYELGCNNNDLSYFKTIKTLPIDLIGKFKGTVVLYKKEDVLARLSARNVEYETYSTSDVRRLLNLPFNINFLKKMGVTPITIPGIIENQWNKAEIDSLLATIIPIYDYYLENFITVKEFESLFNIRLARIERAANILEIRFEYHKVPEEIRIGKFRSVTKIVSKKEIVPLMNHVIEYINLNLDERKNLISTIENFNKNLKHSSEKVDIFINSLLKPKRSQDIIDFMNYIDIKESENFEEFLDTYDDPQIQNIRMKKLVISQNDILKKFDITYTNFTDIIRKNKKTVRYIIYKSLCYYALRDIDLFFESLINQQNELLAENITSSQSKELGLKLSHISKYKSEIKIPSKLRFGIIKIRDQLYNKSKCIEIANNNKKYQIINKYRDEVKNTLIPGTLLNKLIIELKDEFEGDYLKLNLETTELLWYKFIENKINNSNGNENTISDLLIKLVNLTEEFFKLVNGKEITEWTTNEVNLKILNANISPYQRLEIKIFLETISKNNKVTYHPEGFIDIYKIIDDSKNKRDIESYSIEEFIMLIDYLSNVELHKKEAIKDIRKPLRGNLKYREYQSVWLYILIHLNNAWRSTDIIEKIPRITLPPSISNLTDYENHEITSEEIDLVLWELVAKIIGAQHNKNAKEAYFFFSEELKEPLANALILCELKCQMERPLSNNLIKLTDKNTLSCVLHNKSAD